MSGSIQNPVSLMNPRTASWLWRLRCLPAYLRLRLGLKDPARAQSRILEMNLRRNRDTLYGRKHAFSKLKTAGDFQKGVPIVSYEDMDPWIGKILRGERQVLTEEPVAAFERTSGSSGPSKLIPYTVSLLREFREAVRAWMYDLFMSFPSALGKTYWTLTPLAQQRSSEGGIQVGFETDMEYFDRFERALLRQIQAVPAEVVRCSNLEASLYLTLRFLIQSPELSWVSLWNPTFLDALMERFEKYGDRLIAALKTGALNSPVALGASQARLYESSLLALPERARRLEHVLRSKGQMGESDLFPNLSLISCWADGSAKLFIPRIREKFPDAVIQGKGLLATEGVVSIPWQKGPGSVLSIHSHFYEFLESGSRTPLLAGELEKGRLYEVIVTTGGGFYRYRLGDHVRVLGHAERTPLLEFVGRGNGVADLCGEKLEPHFVDGVLEKLRSGGGFDAKFVMLAPLGPPSPAYGLFVEGKIFSGGIAEDLDRLLKANPHYDYCRALGQLGAPRIFRITKDSQEAYLLRGRSQGQRLGCVKFNSLDSRQGWEHVFEGRFLDVPAGERVGAG